MSLLFWYFPYMIMSGIFDTFYQDDKMQESKKGFMNKTEARRV